MPCGSAHWNQQVTGFGPSGLGPTVLPNGAGLFWFGTHQRSQHLEHAHTQAQTGPISNGMTHALWVCMNQESIDLKALKDIRTILDAIDPGGPSMTLWFEIGRALGIARAAIESRELNKSDWPSYLD